MPLPLIPLLIIGSGAIAGGKGLIDAIDASFIREEAEKKINERKERYENFYYYYKDIILDANKEYEDFCVVRNCFKRQSLKTGHLVKD